jgi:hypothetical protein
MWRFQALTMKARFLKRYVLPIRIAIFRSNLSKREIGIYLWARSAKDRNAIVYERHNVNGGSGLTNEEADAHIFHYMLSGHSRILSKISKIHDDLVDEILLLQVESGIMDLDKVSHMREAQKKYASLKCLALDGDFSMAGQRASHDEIAWHRRKDEASFNVTKNPPCNPLNNIFHDLNVAINCVCKNNFEINFRNDAL